MRDGPQLTLHLGLHKTGTTYLQRAVFPNWPEIDYLGRPYRRTDAIQLIAESRSDRVLLSNETLMGSLRLAYTAPAPGWLERQLAQVRRLGAIFPNARAILGLRGHGPWALSIYKHYLKYGGTEPLERFFGFEDGEGVLPVADLRLAPRVEAVREAFPAGVFIYHAKELRERPAELFGRLAEFLGSAAPDPARIPSVTYNEGVDAAQARVLRALNRRTGGFATPRGLRRARYRIGQAWGALHRDRRPLELPEDLAARFAEALEEDRVALNVASGAPQEPAAAPRSPSKEDS